jgi:AcrR family transcriptional regulator
MRHPALKLTEGPAPPPRGVRAATFHLLLDTAMELIREAGHVPSVAEVAQRSKVSRATAYRYFTSRSALIAAVMDASLGPLRGFSSTHADGPSRVRDVFEKTFPRFREFEAPMRAAVQLSLEQWARERAGLLEEEPYRRGHRVRILGNAIAPLAEALPAAAHLRLHQALTVVYGIETWVILKDIWGLSDRAVERVALWMADALVAAALAEAPADRKTRTASAPASRTPRTRKPASR